MTAIGPLIVDLVAHTLRHPREAARRLIGFDLPMEARWLGLLLVAVVALLETRIALLFMPADQQAAVFSILADPWLGVAFQILSLVIIAGAMAYVGRVFGGQGSFADALLLVAWLEFLLTLAQAVQMLVMFVAPPLATLIAFAALGMFLWLLAQFTAALHGFRDLAKVFVGMVASFFVIVVVLAVLLSMLGVLPPIEKV